MPDPRALLPLLLAPLLAGCLAAPAPVPLGAGLGPQPGVHPWPSGTGVEWPAALDGPFDLRELLAVEVPSHDGVVLDGWVYLPELPEGVLAPVVLQSTPYLGYCGSFNVPSANCGPTPEQPSLTTGSSLADFAQPYVERGYALALFSVRGTGNSGGCFGFGSAAEQQDQAVLVEWLAAQPWSNGRVAMYGLSYPGTTPWEAAVLNPPSLKTILPGGIISDPYLFFTTPQGAEATWAAQWMPMYGLSVSVVPPLGGGALAGTVEHAPVLPERACDDVVHVLSGHLEGRATGDRDEAFWAERRLVDRFPGITAAVFVAHGLEDNSGHGFQEDAIWATLDQAPKRMLLGQWGHQFPFEEHLEGSDLGKDWAEVRFAWFDYWLKGLGEAPRLGVADYQDEAGDWHAGSAWPPAEASEEVLYLAAGEALAAPGSGATAFRALPHETAPEDALCGDSPLGTRFLTEPLAEPAVLAGNPMASVALTSDQPGGVVAVHLWDLAPEFACSPAGMTGATFLTRGAADLRFHEGNLAARDFPAGVATPLRIDLWNIAVRIEAGHRLAATVTGGWLVDRSSAVPYVPDIEVLADGGAEASHLVLPLVEGTLGGAAPTLAYPPRPFVPA